MGLEKTYLCVRLSNFLDWIHPDFFKLRLWEKEPLNMAVPETMPKVNGSMVNPADAPMYINVKFSRSKPELNFKPTKDNETPSVKPKRRRRTLV